MNFGDYPAKLRAFMYRLSDSSQIDSEYPFSRQEADVEINSIMDQTKNNANIVVQLVQQAISNISSWKGSSVIVEADKPPEELYYEEPNYLKPVEDASIIVGGQSSWGGAATFTVFMNDGQLSAVDDVLEAGDEDFFTDPKIRQDYFSLVRELRYPGSGQSSKVVTLNTARPVKDRAIFEDTDMIPSNLFMTTSYDRAEGIGRDLGGSSGRRDIWKIRIDQKYLIETLNTGQIRDYQVVGEGMIPVRSIQLINSGDIL